MLAGRGQRLELRTQRRYIYRVPGDHEWGLPTHARHPALNPHFLHPVPPREPCRRFSAGLQRRHHGFPVLASPAHTSRGGVHSTVGPSTRTPLLRSVVVSAISASWLATLAETRGHYQTATIGWLLSLPPTVRVFVATAPCDLRKQFDGIAVLVEQGLRHDPRSGHLYVVFNRRGDQVRILGAGAGSSGVGGGVSLAGSCARNSASWSDEIFSDLLRYIPRSRRDLPGTARGRAAVICAPGSRRDGRRSTLPAPPWRRPGRVAGDQVDAGDRPRRRA